MSYVKEKSMTDWFTKKIATKPKSIKLQTIATKSKREFVCYYVYSGFGTAL